MSDFFTHLAERALGKALLARPLMTPYGWTTQPGYTGVTLPAPATTQREVSPLPLPDSRPIPADHETAGLAATRRFPGESEAAKPGILPVSATPAPLCAGQVSRGSAPLDGIKAPMLATSLSEAETFAAQPTAMSVLPAASMPAESSQVTPSPATPFPQTAAIPAPFKAGTPPPAASTAALPAGSTSTEAAPSPAVFPLPKSASPAALGSPTTLTTDLATRNTRETAVPAGDNTIPLEAGRHATIHPTRAAAGSQPMETTRRDEAALRPPLRPIIARATHAEDRSFARNLPPTALPEHASPAEDTAPAPETVIHVNIGRVEIRAVQPPIPAPERPARRETTVVTLEEYLKQRNEERR